MGFLSMKTHAPIIQTMLTHKNLQVLSALNWMLHEIKMSLTNKKPPEITCIITQNFTKRFQAHHNTQATLHRTIQVSHGFGEGGLT